MRAIPKNIIIKLLKNKDKENILKAARENNILYIRELLFELSEISHKKLWRQDASGISLKC